MKFKRFVKEHSSELIAGAIVLPLLFVLFYMYMQHMATDLPKSYRTQIMQVTNIDIENNVTITDYEGNNFIVIGDTYKVGECYSVLFDTNNTVDITDDVVVKTTFGGVWYTPLQVEEETELAYEIGYEVGMSDEFYEGKG